MVRRVGNLAGLHVGEVDLHGGPAEKDPEVTGRFGPKPMLERDGER